MTRIIRRHRAVLSDDVIGQVTETRDGWTYEAAMAASLPVEWFATEQEAEQALRDLADQRRSEHIVAAGFVGLLAAHPVLYFAANLA